MTGEARRSICLFAQCRLFSRMLRSAPKVLADITTFSWIGLLQKFGLDLFLLHVGHCFLVTFHVCLLRFLGWYGNDLLSIFLRFSISI